MRASSNCRSWRNIEAVRAATVGRSLIDLLVADIGLPGLNGRQVADGARATRPDLKVLFMTGYAANAALAGGFLKAETAMITKPFSMEALASRVRQMIEQP